MSSVKLCVPDKPHRTIWPICDQHQVPSFMHWWHHKPSMHVAHFQVSLIEPPMFRSRMTETLPKWFQFLHLDMNVHTWFWADANWISHPLPLTVRMILNPKHQMVEPQRGVPYQSWSLEMQNLISPAAVFLNQELQTCLVSELNLRNTKFFCVCFS